MQPLTPRSSRGTPVEPSRDPFQTLRQEINDLFS